MDRRIRQTATASPAEPGELPLTLANSIRRSPAFHNASAMTASTASEFTPLSIKA